MARQAVEVPSCSRRRSGTYSRSCSCVSRTLGTATPCACVRGMAGQPAACRLCSLLLPCAAQSLGDELRSAMHETASWPGWRRCTATPRSAPMDTRSVRHDPALTCDQLTWCLREAGMLPPRGGEPAAAPAPLSPPAPGACAQPRLSPWDCVRAGAPAWPGRGRRDAPAWGQALLTQAPLPRCDAAGLPGRCCGLSRRRRLRCRSGPAHRGPRPARAGQGGF